MKTLRTTQSGEKTFSKSGRMKETWKQRRVRERCPRPTIVAVSVRLSEIQ